MAVASEEAAHQQIRGTELNPILLSYKDEQTLENRMEVRNLMQSPAINTALFKQWIGIIRR